MSTKNNITITILMVITLLLISIGFSFAYFTANLTGGEDSTTITVTGGSMKIFYESGANINIINVIPSNDPVATKNFTITGNNTTGLEMNYKSSLIIVSNTFTDNALKYALTSMNTDDNGTTIPDINQMVNIPAGESSSLLGKGMFTGPTNGDKVHTYILKIYFLDTGFSQNENQEKEFKGYIKTENANSSTDCVVHEFTSNEMRPIDLDEIDLIKNIYAGWDVDNEEPIFEDLTLNEYIEYVESGPREFDLKFLYRAFEKNEKKYIFVEERELESGFLLNLSINEIDDIENGERFNYEAGYGEFGEESLIPEYIHDLDENGNLDLNGCLREYTIDIAPLFIIEGVDAINEKSQITISSFGETMFVYYDRFNKANQRGFMYEEPVLVFDAQGDDYIYDTGGYAEDIEFVDYGYKYLTDGSDIKKRVDGHYYQEVYTLYNDGSMQRFLYEEAASDVIEGLNIKDISRYFYLDTIGDVYHYYFSDENIVTTKIEIPEGVKITRLYEYAWSTGTQQMFRTEIFAYGENDVEYSIYISGEDNIDVIDTSTLYSPGYEQIIYQQYILGKEKADLRGINWEKGAKSFTHYFQFDGQTERVVTLPNNAKIMDMSMGLGYLIILDELQNVWGYGVANYYLE